MLKTAGTKFPLHSSVRTLTVCPERVAAPPHTHPTLLMPHSHFVGATCIDFQFVSPWLRIISYMAKREFGGSPFRGAAGVEGADLHAFPVQMVF